ncbi:MAG: purine-nucleoside phosphorylase [Bacteroidota bacterium]|nr:purine-nucleoside phosphorylase [Bacteroidota bacterium]
MMKQIIETKTFLEEKGIKNPDLGIVLGTGLGKLAEEISTILEIDYEEIPNFVKSTVECHTGKLIFGTLKGKKILAMQGRFHYYEGYCMQQITFPIRVMKALGVKHLLLSNAAGALNLNFSKGSLMLIDDHINLLPDNPLRGANLDEMGPRFPDMSEPYSSSMNSLLMECAKEENIPLQVGVYASVAGPNLETRAEYRYLKMIGADAVGMSTVPEVIVAKHMNLPCAAVSVLTDECDPNNLKKVDIADILAIAEKAERLLIKLFLRFIDKLGNESL